MPLRIYHTHANCQHHLLLPSPYLSSLPQISQIFSTPQQLPSAPWQTLSLAGLYSEMTQFKRFSYEYMTAAEVEINSTSNVYVSRRTKPSPPSSRSQPLTTQDECSVFFRQQGYSSKRAIPAWVAIRTTFTASGSPRWPLRCLLQNAHPS